MEKILEMRKNVKTIIRKYENNLIKLNVEVWRSIENYDNYAVSSFGRVKNTHTGKVLKARTNKYGYLIIDLYENQRIKSFIHSYVILTNKSISVFSLSLKI